MRTLTIRQRAAKEIGYRRERGRYWRGPDGRFVKESTVERAGASRLVWIERRAKLEAPPRVEPIREITIERPTPVEDEREGTTFNPTGDPLFDKVLKIATALSESVDGTIEPFPDLRSFDLRFEEPMTKDEIQSFMVDNRGSVTDALGEFTSLHIGIYIMTYDPKTDEESEEWIPLAKAARGMFEWNRAIRSFDNFYAKDFVACTGITIRAFKNGAHKQG